jgi:Fic-DOC domain mobile mystery protein B
MLSKMEYPPGATPLSPDEIVGLKHKHVTTRGELDHLEQANIQSGMQWLKRHRSKDILNETFVRELHKQLLGEVWEWAWTFRKSGKNIGVDPIQISERLRMLLDDVRYWIENKTYSPEEIAVRFHHRLVHIHPFPNGNGRHARIMADALLAKVFEKRPIDWTGGQDLQGLSARRKEYIEALKKADGENYTPLFKFAGLNDSQA